MTANPFEDEQPTPEDELPPAPLPIRVVSDFLALIAGGAIVILMLLTVVDVFKRKWLGQGLTFAPEVTEVFLVAIIFAGMMSAELSRTHVRTPLLTERLKGRSRHLVRWVGLTVAVGISVWATYVTAKAGIESYQAGEYRFGLARVPVWPAKLMIPLGLAGLSIALFYEWLRTLLAGVRRQPPLPRGSTPGAERPLDS